MVSGSCVCHAEGGCRQGAEEDPEEAEADRQLGPEDAPRAEAGAS